MTDQTRHKPTDGSDDKPSEIDGSRPECSDQNLHQKGDAGERCQQGEQFCNRTMQSLSPQMNGLQQMLSN